MNFLHNIDHGKTYVPSLQLSGVCHLQNLEIPN